MTEDNFTPLQDFSQEEELNKVELVGWKEAHEEVGRILNKALTETFNPKTLEELQRLIDENEVLTEWVTVSVEEAE